jgi:hypothetical protein
MWVSLILALATSIPVYLEPMPPDFPTPVWLLWVVVAVVWLLFGLLIVLVGRGHNWARIVMLVLFVVGIGLWVRDSSALFELPIHSLALEVIDTLISLLALYWLFTGSSAAWFKREKHV